jgi:predicted amidohydrolase YtcJ
MAGKAFGSIRRCCRSSGITAATPDPDGGFIERDPATRAPTGILRGAARRLVTRHMPEPSTQDLDLALREELRQLARLGITGFHDAYAPPESLETYQRAEREGKLMVLVRASIPVGMGASAETDQTRLSELSNLRRVHRGNRFAANAIKIHVDGMIDLRTAALLEPYAGDEGIRSALPGYTNYSQDRLNELATRLDREGFQLHFHAVGDRAVRMAFNALEAARRQNGSRDARHIIAHAHLIDDTDAGRFARLGAIAGLQPVLATDQTYLAMIRRLLGVKRAARLFPLQLLSDAGARVAAGSDAPDSSPNPLQSIESASRGGLPLADAIRAQTIEGAWQHFLENESGSLKVGKRGDFIMLDRNLFEMPSTDIHRARVLWTVIGGQEVYRAENWNGKTEKAQEAERLVVISQVNE